MREHKYKAWDKELKKMVSIDREYEEIVVGERGVYLLDSEPYGHFQPNWIPLEYTGKKDKNGKEIFEGDIVKATNWYTAKFKEHMTPRIVEIKWGKVSDYEYDNVDAYGFVFPEYKEIEVIGNIYENKELLK